jgi:hypothetical protein
LGALVPSTEQDDDLLAIEGQIYSISGPEVLSKLDHAFSGGAMVAEVAVLEPIQPNM